uniref:Uncharacterized protein n=1 Tax=viral metagenome TaxID=1070528 RepID=A0A6C0CH73_9ZZZZ
MHDRTILIGVVAIVVVIVVVWWFKNHNDDCESVSKSHMVTTPLTPDRIMVILRDPSTKEHLMAKFSNKGDLSNSETFINIMLDHIEGLIMPRK